MGSGGDQRAQGFRSPSLPADHLPDVTRRNGQLDDRHPAMHVLDDRHLLGVIDQRPGRHRDDGCRVSRHVYSAAAGVASADAAG